MTSFERLRLDMRHAVRLWAKTPAFTVLALLTLGIGIGASTALVAQMNAVFWRALPVATPEALRLVVWTSPRPSFVAMPWRNS
jgi:hypothetical protein